MVNKEYDSDTDTWMLVEEYEYQANILSGGDGARQLAANKLFRLRKDMHKKIHELSGKDTCEFCFSKEIENK